MAKARFVGDETSYVPVLNRTVEPDELVEIDDAVFKSYDWPESLWAVTEKKSTKGKG